MKFIQSQAKKIKHKKKKSYTTKTKIVLLVLAILFLMFSIFLCFFSLGYFTKNETPLLYSYNINNNLNYRVVLKPNNYIDEESLGMNELYITDLVDYIEINFDYLYSASKLSTLSTEYQIDATIYGEYNEGNSDSTSKVWTKNYNLVPAVNNVHEDSNQLGHKPQLQLRLDEYIRQVVDFQKSLHLPLKTSLVIKFSTTTASSEFDLSQKTNMELELPLNEQVFSIKTNYNKKATNSIYDDTIDYSRYTNYPLLVTSIILVLIAVFLLYKKATSVIGMFHKNEYDKRLQKIKRDYSDILVDLADPVKLDDYQVIEIKTYEDLMDVEEELHIPILYYEFVKEKESWFMIINQQLVYRYILKKKHK